MDIHDREMVGTHGAQRKWNGLDYSIRISSIIVLYEAVSYNLLVTEHLLGDEVLSIISVTCLLTWAAKLLRSWPNILL